MTPKPPAFQFYAAEFLADENTIVMETVEVGAYWLLVCICWREGSLPDNMARLSKLARQPEKAFQKMWESKIKICFRLKGKKWVHPRLEKERAKQIELSQKRSDAGKTGGRPKSEKQMKSNCLANEKQKKALQSSSSSSSSSSINTPLPPNEDGLNPDGIQLLWNTLADTRLPRCQGINNKRAASIRERIREHPKLDDWENAIIEIGKSDWHTGTNDRGWRAGIDWLIAPGNILKMLERTGTGKWKGSAPERFQPQSGEGSPGFHRNEEPIVAKLGEEWVTPIDPGSETKTTNPSRSSTPSDQS